MKKTFAIIMAMVMAVTVSAQNRQQGQQGQRKQFDPTEMATRRAQQLKDSLNLTDKQYNQILAVYQEDAKEMQTMMSQSKARRDSMKTKTDGKTGASEQAGQKKGEKKGEKAQNGEQKENPMKARQEAQDAKIKAILTTEQYTKYQQMQKNRQNRRGPGNGRQGMGMGPRGGQGGPQGPCTKAPRRNQGCCCCK